MIIFAHNVNFYKENVIGLRDAHHHAIEMDYDEMVKYMTDWVNVQLNSTYNFLEWVEENYTEYELADFTFEQIKQEYAENHLETSDTLENLWKATEGKEWEPIEEEWY